MPRAYPPTPVRRPTLLAGTAAMALALAAPAGAAAADAPLLRAAAVLVPAAERAASGAGGPAGTQVAYDAARDLQEALRAAGPPSAACAPLRAAVAAYAAARVREMEGIDRLSGTQRAAGARAATGARARIGARTAGCRARGRGTRPPRPLAMSPAPGEAFFGAVVARAPAGAGSASLELDGRTAGTAPVRGGRVRFAVAAAPGPHDLRVRFEGGRVATAAGAVLLPPSAGRAPAAPRDDAALAAALGSALAYGPRYRAAWVHDLTDGRAAGVGADAPFPAASTVKLGLMAGALARLGAAPERSPYAYDLRAMAGWSSNLAANRLLRRLGGAAVAADGLRRLGARASTFPGEYLVGTALGPPAVSRRVTTARDLGRMLLLLHATAAGAPGAGRTTGLTAHAARLAIGWLAASEQRGDNRSLLAAPAPGLVVAQKNGWIRAARLGAAIVYGPRGPAIAVVATYDDRGVSLGAAKLVGARVAALLR